MKKVLSIIAVAAVLLVSCSKDKDTVTPSGKLSNVIDGAVYTPQEFTSAIANGLWVEGHVGDVTLAKDAVNVLLSAMGNVSRFYLDTVFAKREGVSLLQYKRSWHIESYTFTYGSTSASGEPIVLSGRVTFPNSANGNQVNSISLFGHNVQNADQMPYYSLSPVDMRVLFNSAVISPDFQGYGVTHGTHYPGFSFLTCGKQMIDCMNAALAVMEAHGVTTAPHCYTTGWGYSSGAPLVMGMVRYHDEYLTAAAKRKINLKSVNVGMGVYDAEKVVKYFDAHPLYDAHLMCYVMPFIAALPESLMRGYTCHDFMPEWMDDYMIEINGEEMSFATALLRDYDVASLWPKKYNARYLKNNLASDMTNKWGRLDYENPKTKALVNLLHDLSNWGGWIPSVDVYMAHGEDDDCMPYQQAKDFYTSKSARGTMHWKDVEAPSYSFLMDNKHTATSLEAILNSVRYEDPAVAFRMAR